MSVFHEYVASQWNRAGKLGLGITEISKCKKISPNGVGPCLPRCDSSQVETGWPVGKVIVIVVVGGGGSSGGGG